MPEPKKLDAVKTLTGRASRLGLKKSASREKPAGVSTASPTPTIIRAKKSWAYVCARPQQMAATVQAQIPTVISRRRLVLSAIRPSGIATSA